MKVKYSNSIQSLREDEIELIFAILDKRTMSGCVRKALMGRYNHGWSYSYTEVKTDINRKTIAKAEAKIMAIYKLINNHVEKKLAK